MGILGDMKIDRPLKTTIVFLTAILLVVFSFQNCSKVTLKKEEESKILGTATLNGDFCSAPSLPDDIALNMVFLIDMSKSNIGSVTNGTVFNPTTASDPNGSRFELIKTFIQSGCLANKPKARFAVVGFSNGLLPSVNICDKARFVPANSIRTQVDELETIQANEPRQVASVNMTSTSYITGLECVSKLVESDQGALTDVDKKKNFYHVMFLSDGIPTNGNTNMTNFDPVYSKIGEIKAKAINAGGFILQAILYGLDKLSSADQTKANEVMTGMANAGDSGVPSLINSVSTLDFCSLFNSGKRVPYVVTSFGVVNLTAHLLNGKIKIDSDMDGIPDDEEEQRGFSPIKPRSLVGGNYMLDGYCRTDANQCAPHSLSICSEVNEFNISKCEATETSLTDGVDTDQDGIPDLVEYLKGTNPSHFDSNIDIDGDGDINMKEILKGRDPNFFDPDTNANYLIEVRRTRSNIYNESCPETQERWNFESVNLPLADTLATNPSDPISMRFPHLKHDAGENVFLIYYTLQKSNRNVDDDTQEVYGEFVKFSAQKSVTVNKFRKLGVIDGQFRKKD